MANTEKLKRVFEHFDTNRDEKIWVLELEKVIKAMGTPIIKKELQHMIEELDMDSDEFISFEEFSAICSSSSASEVAAELHDTFDLYDQDHNGLISAEKLHLVLNNLNMSYSIDDCAHMIRSVSSDSDDNFNIDEFQKMMIGNDNAGST